MKTYRDYIEQLSLETPDKVAYLDERRALTWRDVLEISNGYIKQLSSLGVDGKVYLRANRSIETLTIFFALQAMGVLTIMEDPHESLDAINGIVITDEHGSWEVRKRGVVTPLVESKVQTVDYPFCTDGDKATIVIITSGSTGTPKFVMLSQGNLIMNSVDTLDHVLYTKKDIAMCMIPLHHVFALGLITAGVLVDYATFFPDNIKIDHIVDCIEKYRISRLNGVPTLYKEIARLGAGKDISCLKAGLIGGAPSTAEEIKKIESALGMTLVPVYGMTECVGISCGSALLSDEIRLSGVGRKYSLNEVRIVNNLGDDVKPHTVGEIIVKSPSMCKGYMNGELSMFGEFLRTGDLGYFDENEVLHVTGRIKDIIIVNGNNISSVRIENSFKAVEGILDCAVFGIEDDKKGEAIVACVVADRPFTRESLLDKCQGLTKIEIPKRIYVLPQLEQTSTNKVQKNGMKQAVLAGAFDKYLLA